MDADQTTPGVSRSGGVCSFPDALHVLSELIPRERKKMPRSLFAALIFLGVFLVSHFYPFVPYQDLCSGQSNRQRVRASPIVRCCFSEEVPSRVSSKKDRLWRLYVSGSDVCTDQSTLWTLKRYPSSLGPSLDLLKAAWHYSALQTCLATRKGERVGEDKKQKVSDAAEAFRNKDETKFHMPVDLEV